MKQPLPQASSQHYGSTGQRPRQQESPSPFMFQTFFTRLSQNQSIENDPSFKDIKNKASRLGLTSTNGSPVQNNNKPEPVETVHEFVKFCARNNIETVNNALKAHNPLLNMVERQRGANDQRQQAQNKRPTAFLSPSAALCTVFPIFLLSTVSG